VTDAAHRRWHPVLAAVAMVLALGACTTPASAPNGAPPTSSSPPVPGGTLTATVSDLAYAHASFEERLDLYLPPRASRPAALVIWIHGGGWRNGDKSALATVPDLSASPPPRTNCRDIVEVQVPDVVALNAKGYAVAGIDYRIDHDPVAAVQDAKAAVRFLRANAARYRLDPNRFAVWGNSAGGYSAIMLGLTAARHTVFDNPALGNPDVSSAVQAVVDWFGAADLSDLPGNNDQTESPFTYLSPGRPPLPPFRIAQGDADCVVVPEHSRHLHDALIAAGGVATLTILSGAGHEDPAFMRTQSAPTLAFLDQTLRR
jgi:acetyl esterase/lipase